MSQIFFSLAVLACPVGMGLMMWFMMRGGKQSSPAQTGATGNSNAGELARLRAEIDQLQAAERESARKPQSEGTSR